MERYNFKEIDSKWQKIWEDKKVYETKIDNSKKKFYCLEMFPYPSGKIHMGHVRNYTIGDILARYKQMQGFNVLHPMGWDSFGMPAENAAKQNNLDPKEWTEKNIKTMKSQLKKLGLSKSLQSDAVGTLYVTNKGIFYDGDKKNIKLAWDKIMRETINPDSIQLEKSNGSPVLLNGYIDPNEAAIMTLTGQLYESL